MDGNDKTQNTHTNRSDGRGRWSEEVEWSIKPGEGDTRFRTRHGLAQHDPPSWSTPAHTTGETPSPRSSLCPRGAIWRHKAVRHSYSAFGKNLGGAVSALYLSRLCGEADVVQNSPPRPARTYPTTTREHPTANQGGLHRRVNCSIRQSPFTMPGTRLFDHLSGTNICHVYPGVARRRIATAQDVHLPMGYDRQEEPHAGYRSSCTTNELGKFW